MAYLNLSNVTKFNFVRQIHRKIMLVYAVLFLKIVRSFQFCLFGPRDGHLGCGISSLGVNKIQF